MGLCGKRKKRRKKRKRKMPYELFEKK